MIYSEAISYIHSLHWNQSGGGIERTKKLLSFCQNPEKRLKIIHIAGTNGKGSTAAMLASILKCAGYKTGLYTSPYIVRYNERLQIDGVEICDEILAEMTTKLKIYADRMESKPNEFEFGTVLAFQYFSQCQCDIVVLETGLGGLLDPTNVIENPVLTIITALGFDHMAILGSTMREIAAAKAGIIKQGVPAVFYGENREAEQVISSKCKETGSELFMPDFSKLQTVQEASLKNNSCGSQIISYMDYQKISLSLPGLYQKKNACMVLTAVMVLKKAGFRIDEESVRTGLSSVTWPARLEVLQKKPLILADGSHNPQGMKATTESLSQYFPGRKLTFLLGVCADKDFSNMLSFLLPLAEKIYITAPDIVRAMKPEQVSFYIEQKASQMGIACPSRVIFNNLTEAVAGIKEEPEDEVVIVIGSLYLVGDVKRLM